MSEEYHDANGPIVPRSRAVDKNGRPVGQRGGVVPLPPIVGHIVSPENHIERPRARLLDEGIEPEFL